MTTIYLDYDTEVEVTRERDPDDRWSGEDTSTTWFFGDCTIGRKSGESYETAFNVKSGDVLYLVVAVWSTGDSFSRRDGEEMEIFGAYRTFEEAEAREAVLDGSRKTGQTEDEYFPWGGYFESLDYVEILTREGRVMVELIAAFYPESYGFISGLATDALRMVLRYASKA